jgi:GntR family transcriptional regulator
VARKQPATGKVVQDERKLRYEFVYDWILNHITTKGLKGGDKLPSATDLAELTGVSLISVRHALDKLENAGKIHRHQGIGTFVARERILSEPNRPGELLETLGGSQDAALTTHLLDIAIGLPSANIAKALSISPGQPVWEITRRRNLGAAAAILEQAILPLSLVPALEEDKLAAGDSMYRFLADRYGLRDEYSEQSLEVDKPTAMEREVLELTARDQIIRIRGVSFTAEGKAFDCYRQTYRAADFIFYIAGSGNRRLLQPTDIGEWEVQPLSRPQAPGGSPRAAATSGEPAPHNTPSRPKSHR